MDRDKVDEASEPSMVPSTFEEEVFTSQYTILKALGQGCTAKVMLAQHRLTGATVAVKALLKEKWLQARLSEVDIMRKLRHPNIVSLVQVIETEKNIYLIMEVAEGEQLFSRVRKAGCLKEDEARNLFIQILSAIGYCHEEGVAHLDLKPDNIMVNAEGKVKVIDFGLGARFQPGQKLERRCGAFLFMPPEVFLGVPFDGPKVDMWSLGILLYFMVTGSVPYVATTILELRKQVLKGRYDIPYHLSRDLRRLISQLLFPNPKYRPSVWDIMSNPWLKKGEIMFTMHVNEEIGFICPDRQIVYLMKIIGFPTEEILTSIKYRTFNEPMAVYQLLRWQACQDNGWSDQRTLDNPGATPFPSLLEPHSFSLPPRRRASEPCLQTLLSPTSLKKRKVDVADIAKRKPIKRKDQERSGTAPCIYWTKAIEDRRLHTVTSSQDNSVINKGRSKTSTSSSLQPRGWAKWKRRIGDCILQLCCCLPTQKSAMKVYPQK